MTTKNKAKWIVLAVALLGPSLWLVPSSPKYVPEKLVGLWTSSDPRYADRSLELTRSAVIFGTGGVNLDVYFVSKVEKALHDHKTLYTIHCHREGEPEEKVYFFYTERNGGEITFKNQ